MYKKTIHSTFLAYGIGWVGGFFWYGYRKLRRFPFTWFKRSKWNTFKWNYFWPKVRKIAGAFGRWGFFYPSTMCFMSWYRHKHDYFNTVAAGYVCGFQSGLPKGMVRALRGGIIGALFLGLLGLRRRGKTKDFWTQYKKPISNLWMRLHWKAQENKRIIQNLDFIKRFRSDNLRIQEENEMIMEVLDELNKQNTVNKIVK